MEIYLTNFVFPMYLWCKSFILYTHDKKLKTLYSISSYRNWSIGSLGLLRATDVLISHYQIYLYYYNF